jgi:hypothetical protein
MIQVSVLMSAFYRRPVTGYNVQAFIADDPPVGGEEEAFRSVTWTVCVWVHLVNPKTGKVVGDTESSSQRAAPQ